MFSSILGVRRRSCSHGKSEAEPPTKRAKEGDSGIKATAATTIATETTTTTTTVTTTNVTPTLTTLLESADAWENVVCFLDDKSARNLAACSFDFYSVFRESAVKCLARMSLSSTDDFSHRAITNKKVVLRLNEPRMSIWESIASWWRGPKVPPRTETPWRYILQYAYTIPLLRVKGFAMGPACNCSVNGKEYLLTLIGGTAGIGGLIVRQYAEKADDDDEYLSILCGTHTDEAPPSILQGYCSIADKIWWCPSPASSSGPAGHLVLSHAFGLRPLRVATIDLSENDEDIVLSDNSVVKGAKQQYIVPHGDERPEDARYDRDHIIVSESDGRLYFVRFVEEHDSLLISCHDVQSGRLLASKSHRVPKSPRFAIEGVVTKGKLVLVLNCEDERALVGNNGLGIYVFDRTDLTLSSYSPSEFGALTTAVSRISPDFVVFITWEGNTSYMSAVPISGGEIGTPRRLELGDHSCDLFVSDTNQLYMYNQDDQEGTITFDQINLVTGKKVRTLDTGLPWTVTDDEGRDIHRMLSSGLTVGNLIVLLISSVGSHINSVVTFAKPPPPPQGQK